MYKKQRERSRDKQIFNKKEDIVRWEKENKTEGNVQMGLPYN